MATNNPLTIWVHYSWRDHPEIDALKVAGHKIVIMESPIADEPHLILHRSSWNWSDSMWPYLDVALKAARKDKPKGVKKDGKQRKSGNRKNSNGTGKVSRRGRKAKSAIAAVESILAGSEA